MKRIKLKGLHLEGLQRKPHSNLGVKIVESRVFKQICAKVKYEQVRTDVQLC